MIKNIIFDFGDVFINLDKDGAMKQALNLVGIDPFSPQMIETNNLYEQGLISTSEFIQFYKNSFPNITKDKIIETWNCILKDFPLHRLNFIKSLASEKKYRLILLSNTNELHINWVREHVPFYDNFKSCFDKFYLSHEIHLRKPNYDVFKFVIQQNNFNVFETLFIDDTIEHTNSAKELGLHTWNINPKTEDIVNLFEIKDDLF